MGAPWLHPLTSLATMTLATTLGMTADAAVVQTPSVGFRQLAGFGSIGFTVWWAVADARRRRQLPCFDFGQLCWQFFWVSIPWYCLRSRGWRGILMLLLLLGLLWLRSLAFAFTVILQRGSYPCTRSA